MRGKAKKGSVRYAAITGIMVAVAAMAPHPLYALSLQAGSVSMNQKVKSVREIRDRHVVRQSTDFSCGAAGLATMLHYGLNDPAGEMEVIMGMLQTTNLQKVKARGGFSLLDLKRYAEARGYEAKGYKMDLDFLRGLEDPVLVPIQFKSYRHFIIVRGVIGDRVFVADPAMGNMIIKTSWFERIWQDGTGLVVKDPRRHKKYNFLKVEKQDHIYVAGDNLKGYYETKGLRTQVFPTEF